jgi:hypothetical protein
MVYVTFFLVMIFGIRENVSVYSFRWWYYD